MGRGLKVGLGLTIVAVGAIGVGFLVLFGYALSEVIANPGISLVDGYWIGRLPWTAIGVDFVVIGSTVAVLFGTASSWLAGGAVRRLVSLVPLVVAAAWWLYASIQSSIEGAPCIILQLGTSNADGTVACGQPPFDPFAVAYSVPAEAILLLALPASIGAVIALSARAGVVPASPRTAAG
ncbi:MAG: hypothetical protein ACRDGI_03115 [Candidatus Limnocylindrales bacterium]